MRGAAHRARAALVVAVASALLWRGEGVEHLKVKQLTVENFDAEIATPTLVKFFAPWCGHCSMMAPAYNSLARTVHGEWRGAQVGEVNCDAHPELGNRYQITGYPTLALVHKGQFAAYHGPKEAQAMFDFIKESVPRFELLPNAKPPQTRCLNVARSDNGAHAESDGQKAGFAPFKAVDGIIRGKYGDHGEMALHSGWSWGNNLQQVCRAPACELVYSAGCVCVYTRARTHTRACVRAYTVHARIGAWHCCR
jgi:protein disulfide-isomerase-like protein